MLHYAECCYAECCGTLYRVTLSVAFRFLVSRLRRRRSKKVFRHRHLVTLRHQGVSLVDVLLQFFASLLVLLLDLTKLGLESLLGSRFINLVLSLSLMQKAQLPALYLT